MDNYTWSTEEPHNTNSETMSDYINNHMPECYEVLYLEDSYAEIKKDGQTYMAMASGDGDFNNHIIKFILTQ